MGVGKPVVATGWSGNMDFMSAANSFPVRYELVRLKHDVGPYRAGETWADPSVDHGAELMRRLVEHPAEAQAIGRAARRDMRERFSERAVGAMIRERVMVISKRHEFRTRQHLSHARRDGAKMTNYRATVERVRESVAKVVPEGATVAVVSKGDAELLKFADRRAWHFPRDEAGQYLGYHPAGTDAVIDHLERQFRCGARYLVLPQTMFWWLDFYRGLKTHLTRNAQRLCADDNCIVYRLRETNAATQVGK
jgi:hypothetical protein